MLDRFIVSFLQKFVWLQNASLELLVRTLWGKLDTENVQRICVHRVGMIGDVLISLPALRALRARFPQSEITILSSPGGVGSPGLVDFIKLMPWIDRCENYHAHDIKTISSIIRLIRRLREHQFDLWVAFPQDLTTWKTEIRNILFARSVNVKYALGFGVTTIPRFLKQQARTLKFESEYQRLLSLVIGKIQGSVKQTTNDYFHFRECLHKRSIHLLGHLREMPSRPILCIAPGGKREMNRWGTGHFKKIAHLWIGHGGLLAVIGGCADMPTSDDIVRGLDPRLYANLCGLTSLEESAVVLKYSRVALVNDSGPMHLAAVVDTPSVVIFSARDFDGKWIPFGRSDILRRNIWCSPCLLNTCNNENMCTKEISVGEVWQVLKRHLTNQT